ncbi:MAG: nucleotide exchange factor GrpE [Candidatus Altiarchaeales archaeon]|nr:nucleotide exchange factor GrpE [Candidatus Altiarchaeales archaeon]MBD3416240.1 nucleotide exchange factor GrpE [Candidatus Altiarchaeales archaeon]
MKGKKNTGKQPSAGDGGAVGETEDYKALLQRVQADFENYRKRVDRDREDSRRYANQKIVEEFLEVKDNLERALDNNGESGSVVEGVKLTLKQLDGLLKKHGVEEMNPSGCAFDPRFHEAVLVEEGDVDEECVGEVLQKGYVLHERVVRPAKVKIFKPREE